MWAGEKQSNVVDAIVIVGGPTYPQHLTVVLSSRFNFSI